MYIYIYIYITDNQRYLTNYHDICRTRSAQIKIVGCNMCCGLFDCLLKSDCRRPCYRPARCSMLGGVTVQQLVPSGNLTWLLKIDESDIK